MRKKARYSWKTSKSVFAIYCLIYNNAQTTLTELEKKTKKNKSTITDKLLALLNEELITKQYTGKEMTYQVNEKKLFELLGAAPSDLDETINLSSNFEELFSYYSEGGNLATFVEVRLTQREFKEIITALVKTKNPTAIKQAKRLKEKSYSFEPL